MLFQKDLHGLETWLMKFIIPEMIDVIGEIAGTEHGGKALHRPRIPGAGFSGQPLFPGAQALSAEACCLWI